MCDGGKEFSPVVGGYEFTPASEMMLPFFKQVSWSMEIGRCIRNNVDDEHFKAMFNRGVRNT